MAEVHGGAAVDFAWYLKSASAHHRCADVEYETAALTTRTSIAQATPIMWKT
jgi:hypothetical protein